MSKNYEERYVRTYGSGDYDYRPRRRSSSRSRVEEPSGRYSRQKVYSRSNSGSSMSSVSDYEYTRGGHYTSSERQLVRLPRDVIRAPTPPPVIQRVVERAPTPEPDILERVIVRPQPQQLIERIIERPATPPPKIIDKEITEPAPPPIVRTRVVKVDSRSYGRTQVQHQHQPQYLTSYPQTIVQRPVTTTISRPSLPISNYGYTEPQYVDTQYYNYAPDRSYSTTFSTTELLSQPSYAAIPSQQHIMQPMASAQTVTYQQQQQSAPSVYPSYAPQQYPQYANYGYQYGYKPVYNAPILPQASNYQRGQASNYPTQ